MVPCEGTESLGSPKVDAGATLEAAAPVSFGKYMLCGLIAKGGMAEVYRARSSADPTRLFAIKCMRERIAKESRFVDMFIREGRLALLLKHSGIVSTFDVGCVDGRYFIGMEYIEGKDLTQVLRRCQERNVRIPVPHAIYITIKIAEALHYAHGLTGEDGGSLRIVNRDVSPANVRISYAGEVKLLDFGIAQALMKFTSEIGVLKGKFSYMSPEQIRGMPLDHRTDIFSTGIILHEMLTLEKLFRADTEFALMEKVRKAEVLPPSRFNRRVPPELDAICLRALARNVKDRYPTADTLVVDLQQLLVGYQFDPGELTEFIRSVFHADIAKELAESAACFGTPTAPNAQPDAPAPPIPAPPVRKPGLWARIIAMLARAR